MPKCGSQVILCDVPIRFDTYSGCSHGCKYCFANRKIDISKVRIDEGPKALLAFIRGKRAQQTSWCDWNIPLHWGGMSDPFQPCERVHKNSLACLKIFAETKYPFIVSTKGTLPMEEPYYSLFKQCNCVFQVSMTCPSITERLEKGAPSFEERLELVRKMTHAAKRVVVRCQPYMLELHREICNQIPKIAGAGAYGIIYEALKLTKSRPGMEKNGADFVYPYVPLHNNFADLKETCHKHQIKFLCGENRLRAMSDSLTCCGCEGLAGFQPSTCNLNHFIYDLKSSWQFTPAMKERGSAECFKCLGQDTKTSRFLKNNTFMRVMKTYFKDKKVVKTYLGLD